MRLTWLWRRRRASVRLRLALTYSSLFVLSGATLLGVSYLLVSHREHAKGTSVSIVCRAADGTPTQVLAGGDANSGFVAGKVPSAADINKSSSAGQSCSKEVGFKGGGVAYRGGAYGGGVAQPIPTKTSPTVLPAKVIRQLQTAVADSQAHTLQSLLIESGVALSLLMVASLGIGWWIAGRVLRPVHRITDTARRLSEQTLHDRIDLDGPHDELKELADTFDAMLARLDRAFTSQRRFVANASHELRTPLTVERVLIDEALAGWPSEPEHVRALLAQLRTNNEETERLIDALLVLARSERGLEHRQPVDLAAVTTEVVARVQSSAAKAEVDLHCALGPACSDGDQALIERLVTNLVDNAIRHNTTGGRVSITTSTQTGGAVLEVGNGGPTLDPAAVPGLVEPFRRGGADRAGDGFGLGLSIVDAIVTAHAGTLHLAAGQDGGLDVSVTLPRPARLHSAAMAALLPGAGGAGGAAPAPAETGAETGALA